jgi:hypothetical protein
LFDIPNSIFFDVIVDFFTPWVFGLWWNVLAGGLEKSVLLRALVAEVFIDFYFGDYVIIACLIDWLTVVLGFFSLKLILGLFNDLGVVNIFVSVYTSSWMLLILRFSYGCVWVNNPSLYKLGWADLKFLVSYIYYCSSVFDNDCFNILALRLLPFRLGLLWLDSVLNSLSSVRLFSWSMLLDGFYIC